MSETQYLRWLPKAVITKYDAETTEELARLLGREPVAADFVEHAADPYLVTEREGNLVTTAGLGRINSLITGAGGQAFTNAQGFVGVGATNTAAARTDAALAGNGNSTTAWYQPIDGSGLSLVTTTLTNDTIQAVSTYGGSNGNFVWAEWCIGAAGGTITAANAIASVGTSPLMINRAVSAMGTKASGTTWVFTAKIQLA